MTQTNYKSVRLLIEDINKAMDAVRKAAMGNIPLPWVHLNELRGLVDQLGKKATQTTLDDVVEMSPGDYVATMKPLVEKYHRQLMAANQLAPCLCLDLQANACVIVLLGDDKTIVRAAHHPDRPDAALAVETLIAGVDESVKRVAGEAAAAAEGLQAEPAAEPEMGDGDGRG